jgi:hypothetical protein
MVFLDEHRILLVNEGGFIAYKLPAEILPGDSPIPLQPYWTEAVLDVQGPRLRSFPLPLVAVVHVELQRDRKRCVVFGGLDVCLVDVPLHPLSTYVSAIASVHVTDQASKGKDCFTKNLTTTLGVLRRCMVSNGDLYHPIFTLRLGRNLHRARTRLGDHANQVFTTGKVRDQLDLDYRDFINEDTAIDEATGHMLVVGTRRKGRRTRIILCSTT